VFRAASISLIAVLAALAVTPKPLLAQAPAPAARSTNSGPDYTFDSTTALLLFYVRPDKTGDFESVVARLAQALDASTDPIRRQQAAAWRMMRSSEPGRDAVVYVFLLDPVVPGADYDPVRVLSESLPAEVQPLYEKLKASVTRVERMALTKIR
jgi:hypothetical protein